MRQGRRQKGSNVKAVAFFAFWVVSRKLLWTHDGKRV